MIVKHANLVARRVRYLEAGSGAPIVLIHAFPLCADQWLPQLNHVPPGRRVVALDLPGFHGTPPPPDDDRPGAGMDAAAGIVLELMTHLDIGRAVVCGLSMGGYVAFAMLRAAATRVAALVLADTRAGADTDEARAARDRMLQQVDDLGTPGVADAMMPKLLGSTTMREQPDLADAVRQLVLTNDNDGLRWAIRAMKHRRDSHDLVSSVTCPTTIICGEDDTLTPPSDAEGLQRAIPGARLVLLPRAGHLSNVENPFGFNEALFSTSAA